LLNERDLIMDLDQLVEDADPTHGVVFEVPAVETIIGRQLKSSHDPTPLRSRSRPVAWAWLGVVAVLVAALIVGVRVVSSSKPTVITPARPAGFPASWEKVTFGGLTMYAPGNWPTVREQVWGDCASAGQPFFRVSSVVLDTGASGLAYHCPAITSKSAISPVYGLVVDPGQYGPLTWAMGIDPGFTAGVKRFDKCLPINGLSVCPTSTSYGGILLVAVHIPGVTRPVAVEIGLAGGGKVAHTILYSMRASRQSSLPATTTTIPKTTTTTTTPEQTLPPLNIATLPVPSDYTCSVGLYALSPGNDAAGECVQYAYLVGGTVSDPNNSTACPAGSFMTIGPVECENQTGIVTAVPPGRNTCSTPGGPCPSSNLPLSSLASVIAWSAVEFPTGKCPGGYYFGETNGIATCVPYAYLPGGTSSNPNKNTACPAASALKVAKLTGTLCTQDVKPYDIVAPTPPQT
jgi:hypothetical protein